ncbi:MAG: chorismate-binding protein [Marinifilaceae bacterium]
MATLAAIWKICRDNNIPFYTYILPGEDEIHFGAQLSNPSITGVSSAITDSGFIMHPYSNKEQTLFIKNDFTEQDIHSAEKIKWLKDTLFPPISMPCLNLEVTKEQYLTALNAVIKQIDNILLKKVVYSRVISAPLAKELHTHLFNSMRHYRHAFRFWVYAPGHGEWMGASPETLLSYVNKGIETMSLAGTQSTSMLSEWGEKEKEEQQMVTDYIADCFAQAGIQRVTQSPLHTHTAGPVAHLCTRFTATEVTNVQQAQTLLELMHPTPAVCGLPVGGAQTSIACHELHKRRYYAGYLGPVTPGGDFRFFVNIRSMELAHNMAQLYVGGGITALSNAEAEWQETENKARTLLTLINDIQHG